jgi:hypothetical protein
LAPCEQRFTPLGPWLCPLSASALLKDIIDTCAVLWLPILSIIIPILIRVHHLPISTGIIIVEHTHIGPNTIPAPTLRLIANAAHHLLRNVFTCPRLYRCTWTRQPGAIHTLNGVRRFRVCLHLFRHRTRRPTVTAIVSLILRH